MCNMNYLTVIICLFFTGCTTITNVSNSEVFISEIGKKELIKKAFICEVENTALPRKELPKNVIYQNHGFEECPRGKHIASLDKGFILDITEISYRLHFGLFFTEHWFMVGKMNIDGENMDFYYRIGITTTGHPPIAYKEDLLWK